MPMVGASIASVSVGLGDKLVVGVASVGESVATGVAVTIVGVTSVPVESVGVSVAPVGVGVSSTGVGWVGVGVGFGSPVGVGLIGGVGVMGVSSISPSQSWSIPSSGTSAAPG